MENIISWVLQLYLAAFFFKPALNNLTWSADTLVTRHMLQPGQKPVFNRFLGSMQALGILGMILPKLLHVLPVLTAIAGLGFAVMMAGAIMVHLKDGHTKMIPKLVLVCLCGIVVFWLNK